MACSKRERTGWCTHEQCPHPEQSGVECVEWRGGFCELGAGCVAICAGSYSKDREPDALAAFRAAYPDN